jgi:signal transduction histidine kinase
MVTRSTARVVTRRWDFQVAGPPRPAAAEAGLAAYRTAQEALTNARKHAPGQRHQLSSRTA